MVPILHAETVMFNFSPFGLLKSNDDECHKQSGREVPLEESNSHLMGGSQFVAAVRRCLLAHPAFESSLEEA